MSAFIDYLLRPEHVLVMAVAWAAVALTQKLVPALKVNEIWARLLPLMPIVLCEALVWLPGLVGGGVAEKALLGIVLGAFCGHAHKLLAQTILGDDWRIDGRPGSP